MNNIINPLPSYLTQRDNLNLDETPNKTNECMISGFSMFADYLTKRFGITHIDEYAYLAVITNWCKNNTGGRFDWQVHCDVWNVILKNQKILGKMSLHSSFKEKQLLMNTLDNNIPVPMSIDISKYYKGALGHVVLCIGYNSDGLFFHDPFGNALTNYEDRNGENVFYPLTDLKNMIYTESRQMAIFKLLENV